jgi:hypothetical protein
VRDRRGGAWDDWDAASESGVPAVDDEERQGPSSRAKLVLGLVFGVAMLASMVLCCLLVGEAGQLIFVKLPPP